MRVCTCQKFEWTCRERVLFHWDWTCFKYLAFILILVIASCIILNCYVMRQYKLLTLNYSCELAFVQYQSSILYFSIFDSFWENLRDFSYYLSVYLNEIEGFCLIILLRILTFSTCISSIFFLRIVMFIDFILSRELGDSLFFFECLDMCTFLILSNSSLLSLSIYMYLVSSIPFFFGFYSKRVR